MSTAVEKSWALDPKSTNNTNLSEEDIVLTSLQTDIEAYIRSMKNIDEPVDEVFSSTDQTKLIDGLFEAPKIPQSYMVTDSKNYFTNAQRWIGHVSQINETNFIAELKDLNMPTTDEIGEFDIEDISPEDLELLAIGAAFYWSIGHANQNGQIEKKSLIRFQRMIPWTVEDYDRALDNAKNLYNKLGFN